MRLKELTLKKFGHFQDHSFDFSAGGLHVIYGANEAGKSTSMRAIGDLLFGIPKRTTDGFLFPMKDLGLQARLCDRNGTALEIHRHKRDKNDLTRADGQPLSAGEQELYKNWLGGRNRENFDLRYGLNGESLREGALDMLDAKGNAGEMLFRAMHGVRDVQALVDELRQEADELVGKKSKSGNRPFFAALNRFQDARAKEKTESLPASEWKDILRALGDAERDLGDVKGRQDEIRKERSRITRIQTVRPFLQELEKLREQLALLPDDLPELPAGAEAEFDALTRKADSTSSKIEQTAEAIAGLEKKIAELVLPEDLLKAGGTINHLHDNASAKRSALQQAGEADRDARQQEAEICRLARELGWIGSSGSGQQDSGSVLEAARGALPRSLVRQSLADLVDRQNDLKGKGNQARDRLSEATDALETAELKLQALAPRPEDDEITALRECLDQLLSRQSLSDEIHSLEADLKARSLSLREKARALGAAEMLATQDGQPTEESPEALLSALAGLVIPGPETRERFREDWRALEGQGRTLKDELAGMQRRQGELAARRATLEQGGPVPTPERVQESRDHRDRLWSLIARRDLRGQALSDSEAALLGNDHAETALTLAIREADSLADRRLEEATRVSSLEELEREETALENSLKTSEEALARHNGQWQTLEQGWREEWPNRAVPPKPPAEMESWLRDYETLMQARKDYNEQIQKHTGLVRELAELRTWLVSVLPGNKCTDPEEFGFIPLIERAKTVLADWTDLKKQHDTLEAELNPLRLAKKREAGRLQASRQAFQDWQAEWRQALKPAGFPEDVPAEDIGRRLELCDRLDRALQEYDSKRALESGLREDADAFLAEIQALADSLGLDHLLCEDGFDTLAGLKNALGNALDLQGQKKTDQGQRDTHKGALNDLEAALRDIEAEAGRFQEMLALEPDPLANLDRAGIRERMARIRERQQARARLAEVEREALQAGEGYPLEALTEAIAGAPDSDSLRAELENLAEQEQELQGERDRLTGLVRDLENRKTATTDQPGAADHARDARLALEEAREIANRYLRARIAEKLLEAGIHSFCKQARGPVMERASALFSALTLHRYDGLVTDFDQKGEPVLQGRHAGDGAQTGVEQMSVGTRDQLYLALRLAALEEEMQVMEPLPFIADDLFVHFDDDRARAGLEVLRDFSQTTQVLFFTHHSHLVELAREQLGEEGFTLSNLERSKALDAA